MESSPEPKAALRAIGLARFYGRVCAVRGLSLEAREGEIYGFLGRNGAGKTTTIRMLMGIIRPHAGEVEILGERRRRASLASKRQIGYVSQDQHFYPWMTCRQIGKFVGGLYPTWDAAEYARLLGALELPERRRVAALSGGMKLKLALALALAHRPPLLILDEPTAGLDPVARREFLDLIQSQARGRRRATLFSSHRIDEIERVADRIGIIDQGRMVYEGEIPALRDAVRRARLAPGEAIPAEFEIFREEPEGAARAAILAGPPEAWAAAAFSGGVEPLALEDIFIAIAEAKTPEL